MTFRIRLATLPGGWVLIKEVRTHGSITKWIKRIPINGIAIY